MRHTYEETRLVLVDRRFVPLQEPVMDDELFEVVPGLFQGGARSNIRCYMFDGSSTTASSRYSLIVGAEPLCCDDACDVCNNAGDADVYAIPLGDPPEDAHSCAPDCVRRAVQLIEAQLAAQGTVLVHCKDGSRFSVLVVLAYLVAKYKLAPAQAMEYLQSRRRSIRLNNCEDYLSGNTCLFEMP